MSNLLLAQQALRNQSFSVFLGAELTRFDSEVELQLPVRPEFMQQNGFIHGGIISYLADNTLTFAGAIALGRQVLTSEYKINYLKPAQCDLLIARAIVVGSGKRQAVCRCDIFSVSGREVLCASAQGTIVAVAN